MKKIRNLVTTFVLVNPASATLNINDISFKVKKIKLKSYIWIDNGSIDNYTIMSSNLFDNYNITGIFTNAVNNQYINIEISVDKYINGNYTFNFNGPNGISDIDGDLILTWEFHGD